MNRLKERPIFGLGISALLVGILIAVIVLASHLQTDTAALAPKDRSDVSTPHNTGSAYPSSGDGTSPTSLRGIETPATEMPAVFGLDVPALLQNPERPTGCESLALTNTLLFHGFDLEKTTIADHWLPTSEEDFVRSFMGDPRDPAGNSCMAPCIVSTANSFLSHKRSNLQAQDVSGSPFDELLDHIAQGYPVIVWTSIDLVEVYEPYLTQEVDGVTYELHENSHCVVITGFDHERNVVSVSDSLVGAIDYDRDLIETRYHDLGSQAVLIT